MKQKFYRFHSICVPGDDRLSSLKKHEVWFSDPARFNDPFDLRPNIRDLVIDRWCHKPGFTSARRKALASLLADEDAYRGARFIDADLMHCFQAWVSDEEEHESNWDLRLPAAIAARIAQFGVACLTPQWDNRLMWAHYADDGRGFCIEYEVDWTCPMDEVLYVPVQYVSQVPELCLSEAMFTPHQFLHLVLASKHSDWAYEREVRLVWLHGKGKSLAMKEQFVKMTKLIAGYSMPEPLQGHLKQTAQRLGVEPMKLTLSPRGELRDDPIV